MVSLPVRAAWAAILLSAGFAHAQTPGENPFSPAEAAILKVLRTSRVSPRFQNAPFPAVVDWLRKTTGANIAVDPLVFELVDPDENPIDLQLEDMRALDVLDILLELLELGRTFRQGVLLVTISENAVGSPVNVIYDLRTLLHYPRWKAGPIPDLRRAYSDPVDPFVPFEIWEEVREEDVLELVREHVLPESWDYWGVQSSTIPGGAVIRHGRSAHPRIREFLDCLRGLHGPAVHVQLRVLSLEPGALEGLVPGEGIDPAVAARLFDASSGEDPLSGDHRIGAMNGQRTHVSSGREFSFRIGEEGLRSARDGAVVDVRPMYVEGRGVRAHVRLFLSRGSSRRDGLADMDVLRMETSVRLAPRRWAFLGAAPLTGQGISQGRTLAVLIRGEAGGTPDPAVSPGAGRPEKVEALDSKRVDLDVKEKPLEQVLEFLRDATEADLVVHPETWEEGDEERYKVSLRMKGATILEVLAKLAEPRGLGVWVRNGAVFLGPEHLARRHRAEFRAIPVHDLLLAAPPGFIEAGESYELRWEAPEGDAGLFEPLDGELLEIFVRECVSSGTWDREPHSLLYLKNHLLARNSPEVLRKTESFLELIRRAVWEDLAVTGRFLEKTPPLLKDAGRGGKPLDSRGCDELDEFLRKDRKGRGGGFRISGNMGSLLFVSGERQGARRVEALPGALDTELRIGGWRCEVRGIPGVGRGDGGNVEAWIRARRFPVGRVFEDGELEDHVEDSSF